MIESVWGNMTNEVDEIKVMHNTLDLRESINFLYLRGMLIDKNIGTVAVPEDYVYDRLGYPILEYSELVTAVNRAWDMLCFTNTFQMVVDMMVCCIYEAEQAKLKRLKQCF